MLRRRLKEPFGKAGLTVAILALVLAMVGGAYAAGGLTKSQEKQVTKIAKKYAGKPGAAGPAGPAGINGTNGAAGKNGTNGTSGTNGKDGSPWTAGGTLPKGSTEKGMFAATIASTEAGVAAISFGIPLATAPTPAYVNPSGEEALEEAGTWNFATPPVNCLGTEAEPKAKEGFLCVYGQVEVAPLLLFNEITEPIAAGAFVQFNGTAAGFVARGSWAVTAAG